MTSAKLSFLFIKYMYIHQSHENVESSPWWKSRDIMQRDPPLKVDSFNDLSTIVFKEFCSPYVLDTNLTDVQFRMWYIIYIKKPSVTSLRKTTTLLLSFTRWKPSSCSQKATRKSYLLSLFVSTFVILKRYVL